MAGTLASIGKALGPEEFTSYVLNGLGDDYDNLVENINGRDTPIQPRELYARLLATGQRIQARSSTPSFPFANAATRGKGKSYKPPTGGKPPRPRPSRGTPLHPWAAPSVPVVPHVVLRFPASYVGLMVTLLLVAIVASSRISWGLGTMARAMRSRLPSRLMSRGILLLTQLMHLGTWIRELPIT